MQFYSGQFLIPKKRWISSPDSFCRKVRNNFSEYFTSGFYKSLGKGIVIVEIQGEQNYLGLIGKISLADYRTGKILKHENILPSSQQAAMDRIIQRKAVIKPTLLTYQPNHQIDELLKKYVHDHNPFMKMKFDHQNEIRSYWLIPHDSEEAQLISQIFEREIDHAYIADGHHRFAASDWLNQYESFPDSILTSLFSFDQLDIHDYNRIVEKPPHLSTSRLIAMISKYLNIKPLNQASKPRRKHELTMKLGGEWYQLAWRNKWLRHFDQKDPFDAYLLNVLILDKIFGIEDVRMDSRVKYISGIHGLEQVEAKMNEEKVAFLLFPIKIRDLTDALDHEELLPPKSTWFEPRVKNGLVVEPISNPTL